MLSTPKYANSNDPVNAGEITLSEGSTSLVDINLIHILIRDSSHDFFCELRGDPSSLHDLHKEKDISLIKTARKHERRNIAANIKEKIDREHPEIKGQALGYRIDDCPNDSRTQDRLQVP